MKEDINKSIKIIDEEIRMRCIVFAKNKDLKDKKVAEMMFVKDVLKRQIQDTLF